MNSPLLPNGLGGEHGITEADAILILRVLAAGRIGGRSGIYRTDEIAARIPPGSWTGKHDVHTTCCIRRGMGHGS